MARRLAALLFVGMVSFAARANAQTSEPAEDVARKHFDAGRAFVLEHRYAEAIPEFLASMAKERTVGGLLNLADCYERVGKYAQAWARFREASELARARGDDRQKIADAAVIGIEQRLPSLTVRVGAPESALPTLKVLVDGEPLNRSAFNRPTPVDPGEHFVLATAEGKRKLEARIVVTRKGDELTVKLADEPPSDGTADGAAPPQSSAQRTASLAMLGGGGALIIAGSVFALVATSTRQDLRDKCPDYPTCTITSPDDRANLDAINSRGKTQALLATIGLAAGGAIAVGGLVLYVTAPKTTTGSRAAMVSLEGSF